MRFPLTPCPGLFVIRQALWSDRVRLDMCWLVRPTTRESQRDGPHSACIAAAIPQRADDRARELLLRRRLGRTEAAKPRLEARLPHITVL